MSALTYAEVDLGAIAHNVRNLKRHVGPGVRLMAVVKANAYGHGAPEVARTALAHGADRLAVARVAEGVQLRQAGIDAPILVLGYTLPEQATLAAEHGLTLTVTEPAVAAALSAASGALGRRSKIHVKVDSGMGRFGLLPDEVVPFLDHLAGLPGLELEGLFTHFATADAADKAYTRRQFATFQAVQAAADAAGHPVAIRHCANSATTLDLPEMHLDAVRPGIALYGLRPSAEVAPAVDLRPALTLKSSCGSRATAAARIGHQLRADVRRSHGDHGRAGASRLRRRLPAPALQPGRGPDPRAARADRRPGVHGPVRGGRLGGWSAGRGRRGRPDWPAGRGLPERQGGRGLG